MFPSRVIKITGFKNINTVAVMFSDSRVHQKVKVEFLFVETETAETEIKISEPLFVLVFTCLLIYLHFYFF